MFSSPLRALRPAFSQSDGALLGVDLATMEEYPPPPPLLFPPPVPVLHIGEEEEEVEMAPAASSKKKRKKRTKKRRRNSDSSSVVDDHEDPPEAIDDGLGPRLEWNPMEDHLDEDNEIRFIKSTEFKNAIAYIKVCQGETVTAVALALRWKTNYSPFDSERDQQWHRVRHIDAELKYVHGQQSKGGPRDFLDYHVSNKIRRDRFVDQLPFEQRLRYKISFSFGVHNKALKAGLSKQKECGPGELFLCLEVTIDNATDGSQTLHRAFSRGFQCYSGHRDKNVAWVDVPRDPEEHYAIVAPMNVQPMQQVVVPPPLMMIQQRQRPRIFKRASVTTYVGRLQWSRGAAVVITFSGSDPSPEDQLTDIVFGPFKMITGRWETPNLLVFHPPAVKQQLWDMFSEGDAEEKEVLERIKTFIDRCVDKNGCLTIKLSFGNKHIEQDEIEIEELSIPFLYPGWGLSPENRDKFLPMFLT